MDAPIARDACALFTDALAFAYGRTRVLEDVSLRVPQGKVYGFLGRNGSGKTTTLRLLLGMMKPDAGQISVGNFSGSSIPAKARVFVGYVSQAPHYYDWMTVRRLGRFLSKVYPNWDHEYFQSLTDTLQVDPKKRVDELSGGTQMKLSLALALGHKPPILILDEPTAGVDPVARYDMLKLVRAQCDTRGCSVLFSTHYIRDVEDVGDWVGILHSGRLLYQGPVAKAGDWWSEHHPGDGAVGLEAIFRQATGAVS